MIIPPATCRVNWPSGFWKRKNHAIMIRDRFYIIIPRSSLFFTDTFVCLVSKRPRAICSLFDMYVFALANTSTKCVGIWDSTSFSFAELSQTAQTHRSGYVSNDIGPMSELISGRYRQ